MGPENADPGGNALADLFGRVDALIAAEENGGQEAPVDPPAPVAGVVAAPPAHIPDKPADVIAPKLEAPAAPDPAVERSLARIAAREAKVAEREKAAAEAANKFRDLPSQFRRDPIAALKAIGVEDSEAAQIVRVAMGSLLPQDKVPAQYKEMKERLVQEDRLRMIEARNAALEAQLAERDTLAVQSAAIAEYQTGMDKYLNGAATEAPNLHKMFASKPDKAREKILAVVQKDAQSKIEAAQRGEDVRPMTPAEAAAIVEAELAEYAALFGATTSTNQAPKTAVSLTNKATQTSGSRPANTGAYADPVDAVDAWLKTKGL